MAKYPNYGPVMIDVEGTVLEESEKNKIAHPNTGAVILFSRNFESPEQVQQLISDIRSSRDRPILIAVDQEGGRVQRFKLGFTKLPPARCYEANPDLAEPAGWLMASELLAQGVDFSFAPVLDVDCGISAIIGDRSFSHDPYITAKLATAFTKGMHAAGMAATGKHFPGHGAVGADSHLDLPVDNRDLDTIRNRDLIPFKQLILNGLDAIMPAHVLYPEVDDSPAGFSSFWIQQILRKELNFQGTVFSDDLSMKGASFAGNFPERAQRALDAGCDMVLVCNDSKAADQVLEALPIEYNPVREKRLHAMKGHQSLNQNLLANNQKWQFFSKQFNQLSYDFT